jgi:hypothetical protein
MSSWGTSYRLILVSNANTVLTPFFVPEDLLQKFGAQMVLSPLLEQARTAAARRLLWLLW